MTIQVSLMAPDIRAISHEDQFTVDELRNMRRHIETQRISDLTSDACTGFMKLKNLMCEVEDEAIQLETGEGS